MTRGARPCFGGSVLLDTGLPSVSVRHICLTLAPMRQHFKATDPWTVLLVDLGQGARKLVAQHRSLKGDITEYIHDDIVTASVNLAVRIKAHASFIST